jgi:hypothetical protein
MNRAPLVATVLLLIFGNLLPARVTDAQWVVRPWYRPHYRRAHYGSRGSYANGMANLIRAQAQATLTYEQARGKYIENKQKWTENYYKMREERQAAEARQQERNKHSPESLTAAAKSDVPATLGADALDPVTGRITWPDILKGPDFATQRTKLDELFELRAKTSNAALNIDKIHIATMEMTTKLRNRIDEIPAKHYIAARKFLDSLDYTAQNPAG